MRKWPPDSVDTDWLGCAADPGEVDACRRRVYLSYEEFLRDSLARLDGQRPSLWNRDYSSLDAYLQSVEPMREKLKVTMGFWQEPEARPPVRTWDRKKIAEGGFFTAYRFSIEITAGLETYGIELVPRFPGPHPGLIAQHGYHGTPELVCGLAEGSILVENYGYRAMGLRAVKRGFHVVAVHHPGTFGTSDDECRAPLPGFPDYPSTYARNRLHRLAIMAGGTLIGIDLLASSRAVDLLCACPGIDPARIGMYGLSQGGLSALYLPAMDTRIRASVCSAYFNTRYVKLVGPGHRGLTFLDALEEDKFFPDVIRRFSDSDIVSLIAPRAFAVEAGEKDSSVDFEWSAKEFEQAKKHYDMLGIPGRVEFIAHERGHVSDTARALDFLEENLNE